jgi:NADPH:quinone reductase-like Zn-dependent oxidoreductase
MKAIIYREYGPADVLKLEDVATPTPRAHEVLVKVHAASVNSLDWRRMRAVPFLVRTDGGWLKPKDIRIGADIAGVVEAVGSEVKQFRPGDAVFGDVTAGAFAEYVCAKEKYIAIKPESVTFEAAASTPVAALTALQGLRDHGKIQAGQQVLVNGASGGVGTFAVQIAKSFGAKITGVCRTRNLDMVRSIGADHVIDYTREDFTRSGKQYDLIFDVAANHSIFGYQRALKPNGICVVAGFTTMAHLIHVMLLGGGKIRSMGSANVDTNDLAIIGDLLASNKIVPVIDKIYPLSETAGALRHFEEEHARGKIIISVAEK